MTHTMTCQDTEQILSYLYVYLPHGKMKWSFSIIVLGLEVTMLSFHQECDNVQLARTEEKWKSITFYHGYGNSSIHQTQSDYIEGVDLATLLDNCA